METASSWSWLKGLLGEPLWGTPTTCPFCADLLYITEVNPSSAEEPRHSFHPHPLGAAEQHKHGRGTLLTRAPTCFLHLFSQSPDPRGKKRGFNLACMFTLLVECHSIWKIMQVAFQRNGSLDWRFPWIHCVHSWEIGFPKNILSGSFQGNRSGDEVLTSHCCKQNKTKAVVGAQIEEQ